MKMNKWEPRNYFLSLKKYFYEYEKIFLFSAYHLVVYLSPPSRFLSIRLHRNNQSYEHNILLYFNSRIIDRDACINSIHD